MCSALTPRFYFSLHIKYLNHCVNANFAIFEMHSCENMHTVLRIIITLALLISLHNTMALPYRIVRKLLCKFSVRLK